MPDGMTLGSDPELIFVNKRGLVSAGNYFERQDNHRGDNPEIGGDGHPATAEIRTKVCGNPRELIEDMRRILSSNYHLIPENISWVAGSFVHGKAIGGHIHFGIDPTDEIVAALDGIVSQIVLLMEDDMGSRQRRASKYGQLGDIRTKDWGFEYRPLPSWIVSDNIALGVVSLAVAAVFEEVTNGPRSLRNLSSGELRPIIDIHRRRFRSCAKSYFETRFDTLYEHVTKLSYFRTEEGAELKRHVALLRYIIKNFPDWHNGKDILDRWGIRDKTPVEYKITRTEIKPVIGNVEILDPQAGWNRLLEEL